MGASNQASQSQNNLLQGLSPELQQLIGSWMSTYAPALAQQLGFQQQEQKQFAGQAAGVGSQLENYKGLTPQEISSLTSQAGSAVRSAGQTFAAQTGGVANPALLEKQLAGTAGQTAGNVGTELGSIASQQKLGALEGAGQLFSGLSGQSLSAVMESLGLGQGALNSGISGSLGTAGQYGNIQQNANQAKGQEWQGIGSLVGGAGTLAGSVGTMGANIPQTPQYTGSSAPYQFAGAQGEAGYTPPAPQYPRG